MGQINTSAINFTRNPRTLLHRRQYAYNRKYHLPSPVGVVLPFQFARPSSPYNFNYVKIIQIETGTETIVTASMLASGLQILPGDGFDMIRYLGNVPLPGNWDQGLYQLQILESGNLWYSDYFSFTNDVEDMVKIEWWNDCPIAYRDGVLDYSFPFKHRIYLDTDIGFPTYPVDQVVDPREGKDLPVRITTWKEYNFSAVVPEYLTDAFRLIRQHSHKVVTHLGTVYNCDALEMDPEPDWTIDVGFAGRALFIMKTDTVVTTRAKASAQNNSVGPGVCADVRYNVVRIIDLGTYINNISNGSVYGPVGTQVAVNGVFDIGGGPTGFFTVFRVTGAQPLLALPSQEGDAFFDLNTSEFYVHDGSAIGYKKPGITNVSNDAGTNITITGLPIPGTTVEIQYRTEFGPFLPFGSYTDAQIAAGVQVDAEDWAAIRLVFFSSVCGELQTSNDYILDGENAAPPGVIGGYGIAVFDTAVYADED